jgi:hypothetical protein
MDKRLFVYISEATKVVVTERWRCFSGFWCSASSYVHGKVLEKHAVLIFSPEDGNSVFPSVWIYTTLKP